MTRYGGEAMAPYPEHPLVSVIVPVYNGAEFLRWTLDSALAQTYPNIEVIAVDDGSTDGTLEILKEYAMRDKRVCYLSQANGGVARARNYAIAQSHGEFIAPLDADDLWEPTKIEQQMQRMMATGDRTGLIYSWWVWIDCDNAVLDRSPRWTVEGNALDMLLKINFVGNASMPLFRRHCLEEAGGYNEELAADAAGGCEDWEIVLRVAAHYEVAVVREVLVGYRRRSGSMSTACNTMWRSQQHVLQNIRHLMPHTDPQVLRHAGKQFALYLAGLSFWSGDMLGVFRWSMRAGYKLPVQVLPYVIRLLFRRTRMNRQVMLPGVTLRSESLPEPLFPYDKTYTYRSTRLSK
jgi:glycosyltransferase involved in cell wall biosynthesis